MSGPSVLSQPKLTLAQLREGQTALLISLESGGDADLRLMELGFLPGNYVTALKSAPGGDPRVFRVDGTQIALRRETTRRILIKLL